MREGLESLIRSIIEKERNHELDSRVDSYTDYKAPFRILKPSVKVKIEMTDGKIIQFDITDYFEDIVK